MNQRDGYVFLSGEEGGDTEDRMKGLWKLLKTISSGVRDAFGTASDTMKDLEKTLKNASGSAKRTVASFDQLNRLKAPTGSGLTAAEKKALAAKKAAEELKEAISTLGDGTAMEPLHRLDSVISSVTQAFLDGQIPTLGYRDRIRDAVSELDYLTVAELSLSAAMDGSILPIEAVGRSIADLVEQIPGLGEVFSGASEAAASSVQEIHRVWDPVSGFMREQVISPVAGSFDQLWNRVVSESLNTQNTVEGTFAQTANRVADSFSLAWAGVQGAFSQGGPVFETLESGILGQFTGIVNRLIDGINRVVSVPFSGLNSTLNRLSETSILGIKPFKELAWRATVPKIPHLAQGAVLPANQPFLAVVGDQTRGTNVEAPLSTIQEAVAAVMEDGFRSNLAGHEAAIDLLRQILQAVESIEVGDSVIGRACDRYREKRAVMGGVGY